jgi:hypothetical protein
VTGDDGTIESGQPPDPASGLSGMPDPASRLSSTPDPASGLSSTPDPGPGPGGTPDQPPGVRVPRDPRHPRVPMPGFGVAHPGTAPGTGPGGSTGPGATVPPGGATPPPDIDQIASQVYERIGDKMDHRPDTAQDTPPAEQAIMLRDKAPELYDLWLKIAQEKAATSNYVQRAPYEVPERMAQSGRPRALSAMIVVLAFCGYLASLGGPGPYIGGLIAILDLLVMLALFFGLRPDHLTDSSRARKRRLIPAA